MNAKRFGVFAVMVVLMTLLLSVPSQPLFAAKELVIADFGMWIKKHYTARIIRSSLQSLYFLL